MSKARGLADLGNVYNDGALSNRNLIINGAMQVAQRATSFTGTNGGYRTVDRIGYVRNGATPTNTHSQSTDAPAGFANSWKLNVDTGAAMGASDDYGVMDYAIEAQDLQHLNYGTASAQPLTLSFWVKSNVVGTYAVGLRQIDATRYISATYTVDVSATWEYKTITFVGDVSGVINNDNGGGLQIEWPMSSGTDYTSGSNDVWSASATDRWAGHAVAVLGTDTNYFQITGIQLEVGDTATPFEHRIYGQELALCQRYYQVLPVDSGSDFLLCSRFSDTSGTPYASYMLPVDTRAVPTLAQSGVWISTSGYGGTPKLSATNTRYIRLGGYASVPANSTVYLSGGVITIDAEL